MTPADIDRVFGRGRVRMVTGEHVEVFREASLPGERRRYTKRFLATAAGDFREWTEREWRILARLVGHGVRAVPQVVQFDRGAAGRPALVQTYDAGITVDHWATLLPLERDGVRLRNVFEDCAHWWALARHCLIALDSIHALQLVHLDLKADNVCVPVAPADFDPLASERTLQPRFDDLALIDFAFSLVSGEPLGSALPIARQAEYEYQSPRLLRALDAGRAGDLAPTRELDWRCDLFSLAAMLWRYLPEFEDASLGGWTRGRHAKARALARRLVEAHDGELTPLRPHAELIALADDALAQRELAESLQRGFSLVVDSDVALAMSPTPVTRIALPVAARVAAEATPTAIASPTPITVPPLPPPASAAAAPAGAAPWFFSGDPIRIDPTDVEARAALHGAAQPKRARKAGAIAGALALVAAAAASVPLFAPEWLVLPGARPAAPAQARAPARNTAPPAAVVAAATPQTKAPPAAGKTETDIAKPVAAPIAASAPDEAAQPTAAPATKSAAPTVDNAAGTKPPAIAAARPTAKPQPPARSARNGTANTTSPSNPTAAKTLLARSARTPVPPAPAAAAAAARPRVQLAAAAPTPQRSPVARTWQDPAAPIPWAVAGRTAPHLPPAKPLAVARAPATAPRANPASPATTTASAGTTPAQTTSAPVAATQTAAASASPPTTTPSAPATVNVAAVGRDLQSAPSAFPGARPRDGATALPVSTSADAAVDLVGRANDVMTNHVPRLAQEAQRSVARVLYAAGRSEHIRDDDDVRASAAAVARSAGDPLGGMTLLPRDAQQLNDQARAEYARRGGTSDVLMLQVRAFGANPMDAEVAGNLAFLLLRQRPAQAEAARQLALHALTLRNARQADARIEDWATFAIASALTGRERDARNALLVTLALAPNLDRQCKAALDVVALYGERLRAPVEAMLQSAHSSRAGQQSAFCEWPPHWVVSGAR